MRHSTKYRRAAWLLASSVVVATLLGCNGNEPVYRERFALESEWVPMWDSSRECSSFDKLYAVWADKNSARIEATYAKWNALPKSEQDALGKKTHDYAQPVLRANIAITLQCGLGPLSDRYRTASAEYRAKREPHP